MPVKPADQRLANYSVGVDPARIQSVFAQKKGSMVKQEAIAFPSLESVERQAQNILAHSGLVGS